MQVLSFTPFRDHGAKVLAKQYTEINSFASRIYWCTFFSIKDPW